MRILKQNTAATVMFFIADSTNPLVGKAGLTVENFVITQSKNCGAFVALSPAPNPIAVDLGSGWYSLELSATGSPNNMDTLGPYTIHVAALAGATAADIQFEVCAADWSDVATLITRLGTPANIDSGGATIADNIKKLADDNGGATFDATYDSQNKIKAAVGTPVAFDGGAATLAGNLQKLADDNNGATFNAEFDSQNKIGGKIGTPVALPTGGTADLANMIYQIAGSDFDSYNSRLANLYNIMGNLASYITDLQALTGLDPNADPLVTLAGLIGVPVASLADDVAAIDGKIGDLHDAPDVSTDVGLIKAQTDHLSFVAGAGAQDIKSTLDGETVKITGTKQQLDTLHDAPDLTTPVGLLATAANLKLVTDKLPTNYLAGSGSVANLNNAPDLTTPLSVVDGIVDDIKAKTDHLSFVDGAGAQDVKATLDGESISVTVTMKDGDEWTPP